MFLYLFGTVNWIIGITFLIFDFFGITFSYYQGHLLQRFNAKLVEKQSVFLKLLELFFIQAFILLISSKSIELALISSSFAFLGFSATVSLCDYKTASNYQQRVKVRNI